MLRSAIGFYAWALDSVIEDEGFDRIVYLDADTLLVQPIDELFSMDMSDPDYHDPGSSSSSSDSGSSKNDETSIKEASDHTTASAGFSAISSDDGKLDFAVAANLLSRFSSAGYMNGQSNNWVLLSK